MCTLDIDTSIHMFKIWEKSSNKYHTTNTSSSSLFLSWGALQFSDVTKNFGGLFAMIGNFTMPCQDGTPVPPNSRLVTTLTFDFLPQWPVHSSYRAALTVRRSKVVVLKLMLTTSSKKTITWVTPRWEESADTIVFPLQRWVLLAGLHQCLQEAGDL